MSTQDIRTWLEENGSLTYNSALEEIITVKLYKLQDFIESEKKSVRYEIADQLLKEPWTVKNGIPVISRSTIKALKEQEI